MAFTSFPNFERAYVVSDLHLGGRPGFQMFSEGETFKRFCVRIAKEAKASVPTLLLVNGDFLDFLAEDGATYWNGRQATGFLTDIATRKELKPVFDGLQTFVAKAGAHLVVVLGNHDLELALPEVRAGLVEILTKGVTSRRSRIEFALDGWGYRFRVGDATALATHGNEVDEYNCTRHDILNQIIHEEALFGISHAAQGWKPSAGTVFVIDAINRIKKQYPFIDLLKPEVPIAFLALTVLAPDNLAAAEDVGRLKARAILNEVNRPSSERRFLGAGGSAELLPEVLGKASGIEVKIQLLEEKVNRYIHDRSRNIDDLIYPANDEELLSLTDWVQGAKSAIAGMIGQGFDFARSGAMADWTSEAAKAAHAAALRGVLEPFVETESFGVDLMGTQDQEIGKMIRDDYDVVFAGHTHIRRFSPRGAHRRGHYVNTGTWAGLMRLFPKDVLNTTAFRPIYDLMSSADRQELVDSGRVRQERPVAVLQRASKKVELSLSRVSDDGTLAADLSGRTYRTVLEKSK